MLLIAALLPARLVSRKWIGAENVGIIKMNSALAIHQLKMHFTSQLQNVIGVRHCNAREVHIFHRDNKI